MLTYCEFFAGWVAGIIGLSVGHPLDTMKVRMQIDGEYTKARVMTKSIMKGEGVHGFFKGLFFPMLGAGIISSVMFGCYSNALRYLAHGSEQRFCCEDAVPPDHWHWRVSMASGIGGIASSIISSPIDLIKIRLQLRTDKKYEGPMGVCKDIYNQKGLPGFFKGYPIMALRETFGTIVYLLTHEHALCVLQMKSSGKIPIGGPHDAVPELIAGGLAGAISWGAVLPIDMIKTRIQGDSYKNPVFTGYIDCIKKTYKKGGVVVFFRGAYLAIVRSIPVNGITFYVYHKVVATCV